MFSMKRNQVVVTALAVMVAVAGYLNFQGTKSSQGEQTAMNLTEEGDEVAVLDDYAALPDDFSLEEASLDPLTAEVASTTGDGAAVYVSATADGSLPTATQYFAEVKLDREQTRAKQQDILTEMINNENISEEKKAECSDQMLQIVERIEKEAAAEAAIEAKGFGEAYVRIDSQTVDVVVDKASLTDQEVAQIEDIVTRKTGCATDSIRISTLKTAQ